MASCGADAERVAGDGHGRRSSADEPLRDRPQSERLDDLAVRPAEVAHEDHGRVLLERGT